ncbi:MULTISPECIES: fumarylacetoacetate hydrolase family protein [unclassified Microbacterium]|uniref:fumarylacetoacetate hydrolase family protein n=1 Tax=unclassified Microbacterium TaxID=2609290 RepID=UPI00214A9A05|nr:MULTISPECIES: fumarylacetoacetate hydrolase family protein [unclassified Microbacterium]MCR2810932.1 fumarylacetoacetate hydrolase family protein [Microbacterium sp. zg.B185]WIM19669.1 fumarylacetoacetate hydrolase family protein [Microbacterium sp. zg-B185]
MTSMGPEAPFALARYHDGAGVRLGLVAGDRIRPLDREDLGAADLNDFLAADDWDRLERLVDADGPWRPLAEVTLTAPVQPRHVLQAGANYRTHVIQLIMGGIAKEDRGVAPDVLRARAERVMDARAASGKAIIFLGLAGCVVGADEPLVLPAYSDQHDWELELAVVIGREAFRVTPEAAPAHIAGYTIANDITTRDLVFPGGPGDLGADWFRSKNAPGFLPTGPFLVPARFVDPRDARVVLELNGEVMQDSTTAELIYDVPALVSDASQTTRLFPGDMILTGSPAGNGQHWGRFLRDGDVMTGRISMLGEQVVRCVAAGDQ